MRQRDRAAGPGAAPSAPAPKAHAKLRPVDFASEGIYLCGTAHSPKLINESVAQALAAASRAGTFLASKDQTIGGVVANVVSPENCAWADKARLHLPQAWCGASVNWPQVRCQHLCLHPRLRQFKHPLRRHQRRR